MLFFEVAERSLLHFCLMFIKPVTFIAAPDCLKNTLFLEHLRTYFQFLFVMGSFFIIGGAVFACATIVTFDYMSLYHLEASLFAHISFS